MPQRQENIPFFLKAIALFRCSHACKRTLVHTYTELGEVTHFQAGSPMNKCSDMTKKKKKSQIEMTVSADLYHVFSFFFFFFFFLENKCIFQIVRVPAISFDTLTVKDVKDQDSPVNIQHAIYSFFFFFLVFCFMLTLNKTVWCSNPSFYKNI